MNMNRILVVDDDVGVCTLLTRILKEQQYDVYTSQSVGGAAETLIEGAFDAYLLDYRLSDGTGLQVAEKVRQQGSTAPIILISGYGATDIAAESTTLEIFEVLQKPFTRETICRALERALSHPVQTPFAENATGTRTTEPLLDRVLTRQQKHSLPTFRVRLGTLQVVFIAVAFLLVAFFIFLMFR